MHNTQDYANYIINLVFNLIMKPTSIEVKFEYLSLKGRLSF